MKQYLKNPSIFLAAVVALVAMTAGHNLATAQTAKPADKAAAKPAPRTGALDPFGAVPDTVYAEVSRIDKSTWSVTLSVMNDAPLAGLQIPIRYKSGSTQLIADSAIFAGSRVDGWDMTGFRCDTAIQVVRLLMLANMGPTQKKLAPGSGRVVTIFISSPEHEPVEKLNVDTTTVGDLNLMFVADMNQTKNGKAYTVDPTKREIFPAFVIRKTEH